jgi:phospho-N-acetylmuramoyl-pentapeptide-transferase
MLAVLLSLVITLVYGKKIINLLRKLQIGESVRELGLQGEEQKKGTPTMGGFIILLGILIPTLLFANLDKVYIKLLLLSTVWLGLVGFVDDYLKLRAKRIAQQKGATYKKGNEDGLAGWFKVLGQVGLGVIISK